MSELQADKLVDGTLAWRAPPAPRLSRRIATAISNAWYELRKSRTASIGAVMLVLLFGACIGTPWLATHDPIKQNYCERLQPIRTCISHNYRSCLSMKNIRCWWNGIKLRPCIRAHKRFTTFAKPNASTLRTKSLYVMRKSVSLSVNSNRRATNSLDTCTDLVRGGGLE